MSQAKILQAQPLTTHEIVKILKGQGSEWFWAIQGPCYVISLKYTPLQSVSADPKYTFSKPCIS
jgi:hypothetical protein